VDAELLSHSAENKIRCFRVQQLEPLADVCLSAAGVPTSVETDSARITLRSQSADPRPFASGAVIPGAETSRDDVVEAHERPSFELILPEWVLSEFDEPAP
jgi:hypothetical protein